MENNRFFKFLWRANAIFIFVAMTAVIIFGIWLLSLLVSEMSYEAAPPPLENVTVQDKSQNDFSLEIPYSNKTVGQFTYFELRAGEDSYGMSSASKSQLRNIVVLNLETNETRWVFEGNQQEIEKYHAISKTIKSVETARDESETVGFLLTVATRRADQSVNRDIWVMTPDGRDLRALIPNVSGKLDIQRYGDNKIKLIVENGEYLDVYPLNIDDLTVGPPTKITAP